MKKKHEYFYVPVFIAFILTTGLRCDILTNLDIVCGDSICDSGETSSQCPADCDPYYVSGPLCNDGVCSSQESNITCGVDCGSAGLQAPSLLNITMEEAGGTALVHLNSIDSEGLYFLAVELFDENNQTYGSMTKFDFTFPVSQTSYNLTINHSAAPGSVLYPLVYLCDIMIQCSMYYYSTLVNPVYYTVASVDTAYAEVATLLTIPFSTTSGIALCGDGICSSTESQITCITDCAGIDNDAPNLISLSYTGTPSGVNGGYINGDVINISLTLSDNVAIDTGNTYVDLVDGSYVSLSAVGSSSVTSLGGNSYSATVTVGNIPSITSVPVYISVTVSDTAANINIYGYDSLTSVSNYTSINTVNFSILDSGLPLVEVPVEIVDVCGDGYCGLTENNAACSVDCPLPIVLPANFTFEGLASLPADFTLTGDANWLINSTSGGALSSISSLESGNIANSQTSCVALLTNHTSTGNVSYYYKTETESGYDYLKFYINGVLQDSRSGFLPWASSSYTLNAGTNSLNWCYEKDSSVSTGLDTVWIDNININ